VLRKASVEVETTYPEPPEFVAQGDRVLVVGVATGKIKATNRAFRDDWVFAITVQNGKVTKIREYIDTKHWRGPRTRALVECLTVKEILMYDQSKLSELIRFARVDAGSTVIDVYPGDGDWTRLFSDIVGPKDGSTASCRPKSPTSRTIRSAACGRLRRSRAERTSKPSRRTSWRCGGHATGGCPVAAPVLP